MEEVPMGSSRIIKVLLLDLCVIEIRIRTDYVTCITTNDNYNPSLSIKGRTNSPVLSERIFVE